MHEATSPTPRICPNGHKGRDTSKAASVSEHFMGTRDEHCRHNGTRRSIGLRLPESK